MFKYADLGILIELCCGNRDLALLINNKIKFLQGSV
jgi:hypothetical protein